jgi:hypothetical protein
MRIILRVPAELRAQMFNRSFDFTLQLTPISRLKGAIRGFHIGILLYAFLLSSFEPSPTILELWKSVPQEEIFDSMNFMLDHAKKTPTAPPGLKENLLCSFFDSEIPQSHYAMSREHAENHRIYLLPSEDEHGG